VLEPLEGVEAVPQRELERPGRAVTRDRGLVADADSHWSVVRGPWSVAETSHHLFATDYGLRTTDEAASPTCGRVCTTKNRPRLTAPSMSCGAPSRRSTSTPTRATERSS